MKKQETIKRAEEALKSHEMGKIDFGSNPEYYTPKMMARFAADFHLSQIESTGLDAGELEEYLIKKMHHAFMVMGDGWEMNDQNNDMFDHSLKAAKDFASHILSQERKKWEAERGEYEERYKSDHYKIQEMQGILRLVSEGKLSGRKGRKIIKEFLQ